MKTPPLAFFVAVSLIVTHFACTPTGKAVKEGAITAFLIAQNRYCQQPEDVRLVLRHRLEAKGIWVEIDCEKGGVGQ